MTDIRSAEGNARLLEAITTLPSKEVAQPAVITQNGIQFEKYVITKGNDLRGKDLRGCYTITKDDDHVGFLHVLIFIGQIFSSIISGRFNMKSWKEMKQDMNLCHAQMILGINDKKGKEGQLILAHGIFKGISTTSEDHTKDAVITQIVVYRPVDKKIRELFAANAEQTAMDFRTDLKNKLNNEELVNKVTKKETLTAEEKITVKVALAAMKKEVAPFSVFKMLTSAFVLQRKNVSKKAQTRAAYAAADILRGDKLRNEKGKIASYFCSAYMTTLAQGSALISGLSDTEKEEYKAMTRDDLKNVILSRINDNSSNNALKRIYQENEFMRVDAHHVLSYFAGQLLDKNSTAKNFAELPTMTAQATQELSAVGG